jgi:hypothetical protein
MIFQKKSQGLKKILIILICISYLVPIANAGRRLYIENFEGTNLGHLPKGWKVKTKLKMDTAGVETDFAHQGKKSLKLTDITDGSNVWVQSPDFKTSIPKNIEVSFSFRIKGGTSARAIFLLLDEKGNKAIGINCRLEDNWRYSCGHSLWWDLPKLPVPKSGRTYRVKIHLNTNNEEINVEVNGVESGWIPINKGWKYISKIGFNSNDNHPSEFWIDFLSIRESHNGKRSRI